MKMNLKLLATVAVCGLVALFAACSSDSDDPAIERDDYNAGEFKITNTTRGVELTDGSVEIFKGDELKIQFSPKYKKDFKTSYSVSINNGNPTSIDKEGKYTINYGDTKYTFVLSAKYEEGGKVLSASKTITITQKYNVTIPYVIYMTKDLAELVSLQVEYTKDGENTPVTDFYKAEELVDALVVDSVSVWEYVENGEVKHTPTLPAGLSPEDMEKYTSVKVGEITKYILPISYYKPNIDTQLSVSLKYNGQELDPNKTYEVECLFSRKAALIDYPGGTGEDKAFVKSDPVTDAQTMTAEEVRNFLNRTLPDIGKQPIKLRIDKEGNVTRR